MCAETFQLFGTVLDPPAEPGRTPRHMLPANLRPHARPSITLIHLARGAPQRHIDRLERHRHAGQAFLHMGGGGLLVVVALDTPQSGPDPTAIHLFSTTPGQSFAYHPNIWHAGVSARDAPAMVASLLCCDGTEADVEEIVLETPLTIDIA